MKNKILVVDGMFPNKFAIWRNFLISDLIKNYDVDIAVYKLDTFAGIDYNFDYEFINWLNVFGVVIMTGTRFMLVKKNWIIAI